MTEIEKAILLLVENGYRVERTKLADELVVTKGVSLNESQTDILTKPIEDLGITIRSRNCLKSEGIITVLDLIGYRRSELLKTPNLGRKSMLEVIERLEVHGLSLRLEIVKGSK